MKKKLILPLLFIFALFLVGCKNNDNNKNDKKDETLNEITNPSGITLTGEFPKGSFLYATSIELTSAEGQYTLELIKTFEYDQTSDIYIYELSIMKDNAKVEPNGKVKISIPVTKDFTDYDVLHIKDNEQIERLNITYKDGVVTFETTSFSKFVFVKKVKSLEHTHTFSEEWTKDDDYHWHIAACEHTSEISSKEPHNWNEGTTNNDTATYTCQTCGKTKIEKDGKVLKYTLKINKEPWNYGDVWDENDESYAYEKGKEVTAGTEFTLKAHTYPNRIFIGWYNASDDTLISKEEIYTFTLDKDMDIVAHFVSNNDYVEIELSGLYSGLTILNDEISTTLVTIGSTDIPSLDSVYVTGIKGNGFRESLSEGYDFTIDDDGLDFTQEGTYTITFALKNNPIIKKSFVIKVVEQGYQFTATSYDTSKLKIIYKGLSNDNHSATYPEGRILTVSVELKDDSLAFDGWYLVDSDGNVTDTLLSDNRNYTFTMPNKDYKIQAKAVYGRWTPLKVEGNGEVLDKYDSSLVWANQIRYLYMHPERKLTLKAKPYEGYTFEGWYKSDIEDIKISTEEILEYEFEETKYTIIAKFIPIIISINVDKSDAEAEGFIDGTLQYAIGDEIPDYNNFKVTGELGDHSTYDFTSEEYIIDDSSLDFETAGTYTITYTYKYNQEIKTTLTVIVLDPVNVEIIYTKSASILSHEYNGKAVFISPKDITFNGMSYQDLMCTTIMNDIRYEWIDKATNQVVDTKDGDITINGVKVKDYGTADNKQVVGGEIVGPVKAGEYKFTLYYKDAAMFTENAKITNNIFRKITTAKEFKSNEGSTWVNFELYYYTIVGVVDGDLYVMEMPSIGKENVEADARLINPNQNGDISLGDGLDFAFANVNYFANEDTEYTEFMTGYYGSLVYRSSNNSINGLFGMPYIHRTGYTSVSGGNIYREYGNKSPYGNKTEFASDGSVKIYSPNRGETADDSLRLVKDGDKFVFTSIKASQDTRQSYPIYLYRTIINIETEDTSNK